MTSQEQPVFEAALSLSPPKRAELAELLWASLDDDATETAPRPEIQRAWIDEAERRMKDVVEGKVDLVSGESVLERLRQRVGR